MNQTVTTAIAELQRLFREQLSGRIEELRRQLPNIRHTARHPDAVETLHRLAHGLVGSAGTFGMPAVSDAARGLESLLAAAIESGWEIDDDQWQEIETALDRLTAQARALSDSDAPSLAPQPAGRQRSGHSPLVCLVEDDPEQARYLGHALEDDGYRVRTFTELEGFRAFIKEDTERPAAVVMDMIFPEGNAAGAGAISELGLGQDTGVPVIFCSVRSDLPARLAAHRAGGSRYLTKPVDTGRLCRLLDDVTGRLRDRPYRVLLVDDDPLLLKVYAGILTQAGMEAATVSDPLDAMEALDRFAPDVMLLDVYMPGASGPELAAVVREQDEYMQLPILFLSSEADMGKQLQALELGGDDFLVKPVRPEHLVAAVTARARRSRRNQETMQRLHTMLYESEREHLALDQHALVSIADGQGKITYANDGFCRVSGYRREALLGQDHSLLKSDSHPPEFYRDMWQTLRSGNIWRGEICNRAADGSLYWVEATITPFLDAQGRPYQYVSIRTDITALKTSQEALRLSEERLRRAQSFANIGTWDWNIETGELYWSERIAPLFGGTEGEMETSYQSFLDAIHPDDRQSVADAITATVERDAPYEIEHRVVWPDGTVRWLLERGAVVRAEDGRARHMLGVVQDINKRKQAEIALAESEARLREAQSLARIGDWQADLRSGSLAWSEEVYRIFGRDPADFTPTVAAFNAAVHPDDRAKLEASERRAQETGTHDVIHRIVRPDGQIRHVHELAQGVRGVDGQLVQLHGTVQDITQRMETEARLRESEARFSFAVTGAGDGIWDWNVATGEMPLSGHYEAMLGYAKGELAPTIDAWIEGVHPDDLTRVQQALQDYLAGKTPAYAVELRLRCKDGSYKWILCRGTVVARDKDGRAARMIGIHSDISEQKATEAALVAARETADRANQAKSDFLSSMSHELRTPMNAIIGFAQMLEYDTGLTADQLDNVHEILDASRHLLALINEVLDLAKVESGRIDLSIEAVELAPLVEDCRQLIQHLAANRGITLRIDLPAGVAVFADRVRLKQALLNLLSNAVKYNREGGAIRLEARTVSQGRRRIAITDTGPGIDPERMAELFRPFNRLGAEYSEIEGTGIGLTITKRLVEMMGGEVSVESRVGVGSTFNIDLLDSLAVEPDPAAAAETGAGAGSAHGTGESQNRSYRVLCVDDNPSNLKLIAQIFGTYPHVRLITAHTPNLGIELAMAHRPDLILLDINMPDLDGYQVLEVLKGIPELATTPVVAVTANAMPRDIEYGMALGFAGYLTKPIDINLFLAEVDRWLKVAGEGRAK